MDKELEVLRIKILKLEEENKHYKKLLSKHGIKERKIPLSADDKIKLFGFKYANGAIVDTTNYDTITTNYRTFMSNLIRVILPYPRGNKKGWVGYKPYEAMSDFEFDGISQLSIQVFQLMLECKQKIRRAQEDEK